VINASEHNSIQQAGDNLPPDLLWVILGPTASGKTKLAVALAQRIQGEIISVDSRQVYRRMDIGTGKDLEEYKHVPYHLIDICEPGEKYNIFQFQNDFHKAYREIVKKGKSTIACGGTGMYIQSLLQPQPYMEIPTDEVLREEWLQKPKEELILHLEQLPTPVDFRIDRSSHKRLIRAIEILTWLQANPGFKAKSAPHYPHLIFGIEPSLKDRRTHISLRLNERIENGLITEVQHLLDVGLTHAELQYYGLEYKYVSLYLQGVLDKPTFISRLETEIHRYAKRQMTYFRKMEKDGLRIHWLKANTVEEQLEEILQYKHT